LNANDESYGFGVGYDISDATNISFVFNGGGVSDLPGRDEEYSLGFTHQLGSGSRLQGFVGQNDVGDTLADFGVRFNF